jgi:hypothetical protein
LGSEGSRHIRNVPPFPLRTTRTWTHRWHKLSGNGNSPFIAETYHPRTLAQDEPTTNDERQRALLTRETAKGYMVLPPSV